LFRDLGDDQINPDWNPEWYAEGVHGDSHERSQAQGVGFATGDPRYCDAYGDWADRPSTPFLGGVSVRRAPGTKVRAMMDQSYRFEAPDAEIIAWAADLSAARTAADALDDELRSRFGPEGSLAVGAPELGMLERNEWATGEGARASVERTTDDGLTQSGYAELQLHPNGMAEVFVAFPVAADATEEDANGAAALDALLWGYCDPLAPSPVNCATAPRPKPAPEAVEPPPVPSRPAPTPPSQDRSKSKTQRWQEQLLAAVRPFRDCALWTKRQEDRWVGKPNAYTYGARAAVQCGTPDTIRPTRGIRQLALFRFKDRDSLDRYWAFKLDKIGKPLRTTPAACSGGKQGIRTWSGSGGRGTIVCYLADGRAKLRWTNERNSTYGIVDATHKDIKKLSDWWLGANVW
jgi:hypothetical protein